MDAIAAFERELAVGLKEIFEFEIARLRNDAIERALEVVVAGTPVDSGLLRGEWQVEAGSGGKKRTRRKDRDGSLTVAAGKIALLGIPWTKEVSVINNAPHAHLVNYGSVHNAPQGMIDRAVAAVQTMQR